MVEVSAVADLADLAAQDWREDAECVGAPYEFVDVADVELAEYLIRRYCHRCPVLSACNAYAETLKPEPWPSVYGGRLIVGTKARPRRREAS